MSISRRSLLTGGLGLGALLALGLETPLAQSPKPTVTVYKSPY